jgi:hypothetical protein
VQRDPVTPGRCPGDTVHEHRRVPVTVRSAAVVPVPSSNPHAHYRRFGTASRADRS